jgi:2-dehydro-3-deoxygalactonokinase
VHVATRDARLDVRILPGVKQEKPADVMRGEETQIAGYLARDPGFDGVLCLPGTHTKWAHVSAGEIVSFRTYMTGELFALLSGHSVLRHGMSQGGWDDAAFRQAIDDALSRPQECAGTLFQLRAERLLFELPAAAARSRLSGTLLGLEFAAARPYWLGRRLVVIGTTELCDIYLAAFEQVGVSAETTAGDAMTIAGLSAAWKSITECPT